MNRDTGDQGTRREASRSSTDVQTAHPQPDRTDRSGRRTPGSIVTFDFRANEMIRTIYRDGVVWFVAADVCEVLDLENTSQTLSRLYDDERSYASTEAAGLKRRMAIVNESGLFSLILTSRKPEAKAFRRWITREVIPSVRKTGEYRSPEADQQKTIENDIRIKAKDHGVHLVIVSHERHTVRKVDCEEVFAAFDYRLAEILAHSVLTMVGSVEIAKMRNSVHLDQGIAAEWLDQNLKQAADVARRFLWCAQEQRHRQAEKPILPS